jgi:hypothetical protein
MKNLILFENFYQDNRNNIQNNHILGDFSYRLEQILISISELSNSKFTNIKRNIFDNDEINITYFVHKRVKQLKIDIDIKDDLFYIRIKLYEQSYIYHSKALRKDCEDFLKFIEYRLQKYSIISKERPASNLIKLCVFEMPLSDKDDIIEMLEEYSTYLDSQKYNL